MKRTHVWFLQVVLPPLAFFAIVVIAWQAVTTLWEIPVYLVPGPRRVFEAAREHATELAAAARLTGTGAVGGFGLGLVAGTALGLLFSQSRLIERSERSKR